MHLAPSALREAIGLLDSGHHLGNAQDAILRNARTRNADVDQRGDAPACHETWVHTTGRSQLHGAAQPSGGRTQRATMLRLRIAHG